MAETALSGRPGPFAVWKPAPIFWPASWNTRMAPARTT